LPLRGSTYEKEGRGVLLSVPLTQVGKNKEGEESNQMKEESLVSGKKRGNPSTS